MFNGQKNEYFRIKNGLIEDNNFNGMKTSETEYLTLQSKFKPANISREEDVMESCFY